METKCIFNLDGTYKEFETELTSVLNESGKLLPGDNIVIGSCSLGKSIGSNVRSLSNVSRGLSVVNITDDPISISTNDFFSEYRTLEQIYERLTNLYSTCNTNDNCSMKVLEPKTINDNNLLLFKVGNGNNNILITGGMHAREWMSVMATSYLVERMIQLERNGEWNDVFSENTFYIIPISNPDGYAHTYQNINNRFWRKNMNGVDLNRNWNVGFENNTNMDSDTYGGAEPFTENEVVAIKNVFDSNSFKLHFDIHAFSQMVAASWSYTDELHPRNDEFMKYGDIIVKSMKNNNYIYGHGSVQNLLGLAGGTIQDYTSNNNTLGFTIELPPRDGGINAFSIDSNNIIPVGDDLINMLFNVSENNYTVEDRNNQTSKRNMNYLGFFSLFLFAILLIYIILKRPF